MSDAGSGDVDHVGDSGGVYVGVGVGVVGGWAGRGDEWAGVAAYAKYGGSSVPE